VAVFRLGPVFPLLEAHVDLADVEDKFEDSVAEFGRQSKEGGELSVALPSGWACCQRREECKQTTALSGDPRIRLTGRALGCLPGGATCVTGCGSFVGALCLAASWRDGGGQGSQWRRDVSFRPERIGDVEDAAARSV
jgi:hypothetical protein